MTRGIYDGWVQRPRRGRLSIAVGRNDLRIDGRWWGERPRRGRLSIAASRNDLRIDGRWWGERPRRGRLSIAAGRNDLRIVGMVGESTPKGVPQQWRWATPSGSMLPTFACSVGRADPRLLRGDVFNVLTAAAPPAHNSSIGRRYRRAKMAKRCFFARFLLNIVTFYPREQVI
jgi:hypothetical protein